MKAYRFALDPNAAQAEAFASHVGASRFAYNWALGRVKQALDDGVRISWSHFSLRKDWNEVKATAAPWWAENSKWVYDSAIADAAAALKNWSDSRKGKRAGPKMGFPGSRPSYGAGPHAASPTALTSSTPTTFTSPASVRSARTSRRARLGVSSEPAQLEHSAPHCLATLPDGGSSRSLLTALTTGRWPLRTLLWAWTSA